MACYHPSRVTISRKGVPGFLPLRVLDKVRVPCGHCLGCRTDQARAWAIRLVHEGVTSSPAWFVTLTYSPKEIPEHGSLCARDFTLFIKRLRGMHESERISYYVAGEYGDQTARPHYHAVLYGARFLDRALLAVRNGAEVYRSASLERAWRYGLCEFTGLNFGAARYVASYVRKKVRQRDNPDAYLRVDRSTGELVDIEREYGRMSRRPAIGRRWIERFWSDIYPRDFVVMDGGEYKPPRYYDKWMEKYQPETFLAVREQRYADMVELADEKLIMMEKVHRAKVALLQGRNGV